MHRPSIAAIAIFLVALGLVLRGDADSALSGACLRMGAVMALWWFAHPQMTRIPRWLIAVILLTFLVALRWPKLLILAVPIIAALWLLRPRRTESNPHRSPRS